MAKDELARVKGELLGLEILLMHCLCFIAARTEDPLRYLTEFGNAAIDGVLQSEGVEVSPRYLKQLQTAATGVILQCVGAAQNVVADVDQRSRPAARGGRAADRTGH